MKARIKHATKYRSAALTCASRGAACARAMSAAELHVVEMNGHIQKQVTREQSIARIRSTAVCVCVSESRGRNNTKNCAHSQKTHHQYFLLHYTDHHHHHHHHHHHCAPFRVSKGREVESELLRAHRIRGEPSHPRSRQGVRSWLCAPVVTSEAPLCRAPEDPATSGYLVYAGLIRRADIHM
jgi:ABC-type nickel/cobalt efflux system permease component RcnA